jgi:rubrerythrin
VIDTTTARLAERNMTRARILDQAAAAARPASPLPPPAPDEWACRICGDAWYGTPPEDQTCPTGCTTTR